jgi:hypothetical protein
MTTTTTITTTSRRLARLLAPVLPLADTGGTLPILENVLLRGHGEHGITAMATDRYRIGVCRDEDIAAPEGFRALVPVTALRRMLAMFRATRDRDPELRLEFEQDSLSGVVHVSTESLGFDVAGARVSYRLAVGEYPKVEAVFESAFGDATPATGPLALNARFVGDFAAAMRGEPVPTMLYAGKSRSGAAPVIGVAVGAHFRGAIMQVRAAGDLAPPAPLDGGWAELLNPPAKTPAKVEPKRRAVKAGAPAAAGAGA